jgi:mono/diheme cytochrome c family protein
MLKSLLLASAAMLFVAAPASSVGQAAPPAKTPAKSAADMSKGKKLFTMDCAVCHGDNGNGKTDLAKDMQLTLLDWTDPSSLSSKSDKELFDLIRAGKGKMPPEDAGRAKDDEIRDVIQYIRDLPKTQSAAPAPAEAPAAPAGPGR